MHPPARQPSVDERAETRYGALDARCAGSSHDLVPLRSSRQVSIAEVEPDPTVTQTEHRSVIDGVQWIGILYTISINAFREPKTASRWHYVEGRPWFQ